MMIELEPEELRHVAQLGRIQLPGCAGETHGAFEFDLGRREAVPVAGRAQDVGVEGRVVSGHEVDAGEERGDRGPELGEGRCRADLWPVDVVNVGEVEAPVGRAHEVIRAEDDAAALHPHQADRAGAVGVVIRGLEVDGGERRAARATRGRSDVVHGAGSLFEETDREATRNRWRGWRWLGGRSGAAHHGARG